MLNTFVEKIKYLLEISLQKTVVSISEKILITYNIDCRDNGVVFDINLSEKSSILLEMQINYIRHLRKNSVLPRFRIELENGDKLIFTSNLCEDRYSEECWQDLSYDLAEGPSYEMVIKGKSLEQLLEEFEIWFIKFKNFLKEIEPAIINSITSADSLIAPPNDPATRKHILTIMNAQGRF